MAGANKTSKILTLHIPSYITFNVSFVSSWLKAAKEVQIISQLPALVVEEIQPATVTDSARLAPEEVKVQ